MNYYICKFKGISDVMHELKIEFDGELASSYELIELVEHSFLEAKNILDKEFSKFSRLDSIETFPDKSLLDMIIYYNSNGKYKNIISYYTVGNHFTEAAKIILRLINPVCSNMTAKEISRITYYELREPLWWEDYNKSFFHLGHNINLIREHIKQKDIMMCYYYDKCYYFNIGIEEPIISEDMIEEASWFVYSYK